MTSETAPDTKIGEKPVTPAPPETPELLELSQWLEPLLLKPLWKITSGYFDLAEQWYYAGVKVFQLDPDVVSRIDNIDEKTQKIDELIGEIIDQDHSHILGALCEHARKICGDAWRFAVSDIMDMIQSDRVQLLRIVCTHREVDIVSYYEINPDDDILRSELDFIRDCFPDCLGAYHAGDIKRTDISALSGSLDVLKWENEQGLKEWTSRTSMLLIDNGRADVLQELLAGGGRCPWDSDTYWEAIKNDCVALVKWFETHDDDCDLRIASYEHVKSAEMAKHFLEDSCFKCQPDTLMEQAVIEGTLGMVKYLVEQTSAMDDLKRSDVIKWACHDSKDDPAKLKYLLERGFPMPWRYNFKDGDIRAWFEDSAYEYRC